MGIRREDVKQGFLEGFKALNLKKAQKAEEEAQKELRKLNLFQKLLIRLGRKHYLGKRTQPGWTGYLPFYLFWCSHCRKYYVDHLHGLEGYVTCYRCWIHYIL